MKVDVVLITYNQEQYITYALESILFQRIDEGVDVRVLVADDASTDKTLDIIRSYELKSTFPFVYLDSCPNMGHVKNYKRAFAACDGDYTLVIEGDDYWCTPNHLSQHIKFLEEHRDCSMSVNGIILFWQDTNLYERHQVEFHKEVQYINIKQQIMENRIGNHSSACYRTSILHSLPSTIYGESFDDALVGICFAQYGFIAQLTDYTTVYRKNSEGLWSGVDNKRQMEMFRCRLNANDKIFDYKYHSLFELALKQYEAEKQKLRIRDFIPPVLLYIIKLLLPKALLRKL